MKKILAIDDNNDNLIILGAIIKVSFPDLIFDTATSGKKGIELAISDDPDVILLSMNVPDMDGFEVCRQLKQDIRSRDIPVVFLNELKGDDENRIKSLDAGAEAFLYKPFDKIEFVVQIRAMLKIKEFASQKRFENERLSILLAERAQELEQSQAETLNLIDELKSENEKYKKTEDKLRESEEIFRNIFEYHTAVKLIIDPEIGNIIDANRAAETFYGWPKERLKQMKIQEINIFSPEDISKAMEKAKSSRQNYFEFRHRLADGSIRDVEVFSSHIEVKGKVLLHSIIHDISNRKQTEQAIITSELRLKRAELASRSGNWELHLDSKTFFVSEGAARIYGIVDGELDMQFIKDIPLPEFRQTLDLALKNLIEKDEPYKIEFKIRKLDTGVISDIYSEAYFDQKKRVVFGIIQDITERVKREEALSYSNDLLTKFILHSPIYTFIKEVTPNESRVLKASENFIDMIGIPGSEMIGKNMYEIFPPEFAAKITNDDWEVASKNHLIQLDEELNGMYYITIKYPIKQGNKTLLAGYTIDITGRKNAENALRESELRFRTLANSGQALIWTSDIDKKCNYFNQTWLDFTGRSIEQELGDGWVEGVHPDDLQQCVETYMTSFDRQEKFSMEYRVRHVSGEYRWIQDDGSPRFNSEGEFIGFIGHCLDITDRKKTEAELMETKNYLENLLNYANAPIIVWDKNFRITQFNKAFEQLSGRKESEVLGNSVGILFPENTSKQSLEYIKKASTGERWEVVEIEIQDLKNKVHTLLWNSAAIYSTDGRNILAIIAQGQDITQRKLVEKALLESETRFRSLLQNVSSVSVQGYGFDGNTQYWNMASEQLYGYKSKEAIGRNLLDLIIPPEMQEGVRSAIAQMIETGKPIPSSELSLMRKDGSRVAVYSSHAIVHTLDGVPELFCIDIDLTERKRAEEALKMNEIRLRELITTKDKFFSIISHDLKNPFNSILGLSNLLVEQIKEKNFDGIEEYAAIIQKSSMQAYALLVNLLEWSRSQTGRMEFSPEYVEMVSLINEVVELFDDSLRQKSINICKELPRNLLISVDKAMISTVLRNLISNAIKFTHTQGQIVISAESKKNELIISIQDNGVGIKNEKIEKLFQIGETQTTLGTNNEKGTGLGLFLCKEFVEKHGGKIWVESEYGKGSKFYIEIPKN